MAERRQELLLATVGLADGLVPPGVVERVGGLEDVLLDEVDLPLRGRCGSRKNVAIVPARSPLRLTSGTLKQARNPPSRAASGPLAARRVVGLALGIPDHRPARLARTARPHASEPTGIRP